MAKGVLLIISGPSGSGKGTIVEQLVSELGYCVSISATTRNPRPNEKDGIHYFFKTKEKFEKMIDNGELLEHAAFCGNYYGTPKKYVEEQLESGKNIILEIEVQGALQIKEIFPDTVSIFLMPPTKEELLKRLTGRGTEDKDTINRRIQRATEEVKLLPQYDYVVINDTVEKAAENIKLIAKTEKMKSERFKNMVEAFE